MDMSSQREILRANPAWSIPQLAAEITAALVGNGLALSFGEVRTKNLSNEFAMVIGTSGSTGLIKEVAFTRAALISSAQASNSFVGATAGSKWSLLLSINHIAGVNVILRSMELGTLPFDLRNFEGEYPTVDFTSIVPTQLFRALNSDERLLRHLQSAKTVLVGGAALAQNLRVQAEVEGINIVETYGMTETCGGCVYDGRTLNGVEVEINDQGVIKIRGTVMASDYLNSSNLFELQDGWFTTNDFGEINDGKLIVLGRADDVIITGGENLSLMAIEAVLSIRFPDMECAAFGVKDPLWGQALHIAIVGKVNENEISLYLEGALGQIAKPKGIHSIESLPLLGIGKVDRLTLARMVRNE